MAKKEKQEKSMEAALWESANKLRGAVEPAEYKHVVLSLIFLKYASDKFEERRKEIIAEGHEAFVDNVAFYTMKSVFYLPPDTYVWEDLGVGHTAFLQWSINGNVKLFYEKYSCLQIPQNIPYNKVVSFNPPLSI